MTVNFDINISNVLVKYCVWNYAGRVILETRL